jgi:hypothetical protein
MWQLAMLKPLKPVISIMIMLVNGEVHGDFSLCLLWLIFFDADFL